MLARGRDVGLTSGRGISGSGGGGGGNRGALDPPPPGVVSRVVCFRGQGLGRWMVVDGAAEPFEFGARRWPGRPGN